MTDRPPAERADLEHGDECRSLWADDRVCDCGAETIRDLRAEVERLRELTKRVFVGPCVHGRDPYERCDVDDVPAGVIPCGELEWWEAAGRCGDRALEELRAEISALRSQLTAERDAVVAARNRDFFDAVAAEREYCAQLANHHLNTAPASPLDGGQWQKGYRDACADIESAIRARGAK